MSYIKDDIVIGTVEGIDTIDALGREVRLFLDVAGSLADTPAQSAGNDLSGHTADAYCAYCSVRKHKGLRSPPITFTSSQHSRKQSLVGSDERMMEIRRNRLHPDVQQHIGTNCSTNAERIGRFSANLAASLQKQTHQVEKNTMGLPVTGNNCC